MRFEELLERWQGATLSHGEAAEAGGERADLPAMAPAVRRGRGGRLGRSPGRPALAQAAPEDELERMRALYQQYYQSFTIKHFHEKLAKRHGYKLGYTTTRLYLQKTGMVQPAPAWRPSAQAATPADARHAPAPGRREAPLACRATGARPGDHHG
jgi:hypothetical protein